MQLNILLKKLLSADWEVDEKRKEDEKEGKSDEATKNEHTNKAMDHEEC